jgi:hypothetical protein
MVSNSTNIKKNKQINNDGQLFHQYQQNKQINNDGYDKKKTFRHIVGSVQS